MRLFAGVELADAVTAAAALVSDTLKARLSSVAPGFSARWIPQANLHVTLWFFGELAESRVAELMGELREPFDAAPFALRFRGCGAFPQAGIPRVLWIGTTEGTSAMRDLYGRLEARLVPIGFVPERRQYAPHLTIARVKEFGGGRAGPLRDLLAASDVDCGESIVAAVTLFRSRLSPRGAVYEPLLRVPLT